MLVYFSYLDKNPRWVTHGANSDYYSYFSEDYKTCSQLVNVPVMGATTRDLPFYFPLHLCEDYVLIIVM
jgi:hypothetical protein